MIHWIGESIGNNAEHDQGTDRTYACGRYCGGCTNRGPNPPGANTDCARCAETPAEKRTCGTRRKLVSMPCPEGLSASVCHAGLAVLLARCATCKGYEVQACDGTPLEPPVFNCCETCPPDANRTNDKPCTRVADDPGTCNRKPLYCPGPPDR
jgi:hypothetical protein